MAAALRASDEANLCTQLHGEKGMETDVRLAWAKLRDCVGVGEHGLWSRWRRTASWRTACWRTASRTKKKRLPLLGARVTACCLPPWVTF